MGERFLELIDFGVSALVNRKYCEFGAVGVGGGVLDLDVPLVLEELCMKAVGELKVGAHRSGADGVSGVDEMEV